MIGMARSVWSASGLPALLILRSRPALESAGKPDALHTLRQVELRICNTVAAVLSKIPVTSFSDRTNSKCCSRAIDLSRVHLWPYRAHLSRHECCLPATRLIPVTNLPADSYSLRSCCSRMNQSMLRQDPEADP